MRASLTDGLGRSRYVVVYVLSVRKDENCITIETESVFVQYGFVVCIHYLIIVAKCTLIHEHAAERQLKVGDKAIC